MLRNVFTLEPIIPRFLRKMVSRRTITRLILWRCSIFLTLNCLEALVFLLVFTLGSLIIKRKVEPLCQMKEKVGQLRLLYKSCMRTMEQIQIAREISRTGLLIDKQRRDLLFKAATKRWRKRQGMFNFLASFYNPKFRHDCNVNSPPQMKHLLYEDMKLPVKKKRDGKVTTDEDAIVELLTYIKGEREKVSRADAVQRWTEKEAILSTIIEIRGLRKLISSYLNTRLSTDGRLRSTYKVTSVETARWACELFVDKTGVNAQTFPREGYEITEEDLDLPLTLTEEETLALEEERKKMEEETEEKEEEA